MIYIFCGAYKALMFALYLRSLGREITIITHNEDIIKYCKDEKIKYKRIESVKPQVLSFYKVFTLKKMLDELIKEIDFCENDEFYLTGKTIAYDSLYLGKEFSKKGSVFYKNPDRDLNRYQPSKLKPFFIRGEIMRLLFKLFLGLDLIYYDTHDAPRFGADDEFLKKYNIKEYAPGVSSEKLILELIKKHKSNLKEYDNLIIDDGLLIEYVDFDSLIDLYKNLFKLNLEFAFKKHPSMSEKEKHPELYSSFYGSFKDCDELPTYIPVELLFNNVKKNVFSISSIALITASKLQHLRAISLLELVEWFDESSKKYFKNDLVKRSNNKILFPKNFDELRDILTNT